MPIQIILFDDNKHIRESLAMLLLSDNDFHLCGAYENAVSAEDLIAITKPDVVLMDIDMPGKNGIDAVADVHKRFPDLPIIMLTVFDDADRVFN